MSLAKSGGKGGKEGCCLAPSSPFLVGDQREPRASTSKGGGSERMREGGRKWRKREEGEGR